MNPSKINPVYGANALVAEFVARLCPGLNHFDDFGEEFQAIGFEKGGKLIAGGVYYRYTGFDVNFAFAAADPSWATKKSLKTIMQHAFDELGCIRMTAVTGRKNKKARKFLERFGFVEEGKKRKGLNGKEDLMIYGLMKEEGRWYGK